jgi:hypothetical protein
MFPGSLKPRLHFDRQDVAIGGLAIILATALQVANQHYLRIVHDYGDHQAADTVATVIIAAFTFYVNKTPALARWWLGLTVAVLGLVLLYTSGSLFALVAADPFLAPVRSFLNWTSPFCHGLWFGPLAWTFHCLLRPKTDRDQGDDAHEEALHKVGESTDPKFNIVFVHGIAGHHRTTWQAPDNKDAYWPAWVAQDFPHAQVYALHYNAAPSRWLGPTMPLIERGKNLLNLFHAMGIFRLPSVFIVHSFGGLVLKQLWRSARDQGHQEALVSIKAIIFLATPHQGSLLGYLNRLHLLEVAGRTTQTAEDLEHHNQLLLDLDEFYRAHPIPMNFVYYETQATAFGPLSAKVVDEGSASLVLPEGKVFPVPLLADHLTICKPPTREHEIALRIGSNLKSIVKALFEPRPRSDRFEIDNYEITLAVEPREMQDFPFAEGNRTRIVRCDNFAKLQECVTFAADNQLQAPFTLRYFTKRNGFINFWTDHTNEASAEEKARYAEYGVDVTFTFTPDPAETYCLHMEIYKGFDEGQRCMARRLVPWAHYKRVRFTLDLDAYVNKLYAVDGEPQLYRHFNYEISATPEPIGQLLPVKQLKPNVWQWELEDVDRGVLNLIWDMIPPNGVSVSVPKAEAKVSASAQYAGSFEPKQSISKDPVAGDLDHVFHPQKYRLDRGPLIECRFQIMSPQFRNQFKWEKLADVLVEVIGGLPEEHWGKEAYLIPSGRARPLFWDANNLRGHKESLHKKRAATDEFIKLYENGELQGHWFTMTTTKGIGIGVYCLAYDLFLNASQSNSK